VRTHYLQQNRLIPMRDGTRLFTTIYLPRDTSRTYPVLLARTPYGSDRYRSPLGPADAFARAGYIFAFQDVRGRHGSEGDFEHVRPYRPEKRGAGEIDDVSDTYDTIEWLLRHVPRHNGRVGQYGISYPGYYAVMGLVDAHPALAASSPQAPIGDWFIGDDWHHNGAFLLADAFFFFNVFGDRHVVRDSTGAAWFDYGTPDGYRFFLDAGPLRVLTKRYFRAVPFWNQMMEHGTYDAFWRARTPLPHLREIRPAVLNVGGWFDAENLWGTLAVYRTIEEHNPQAYNVLVIGPWTHGGWFSSDGEAFGDVQFGSKTSVFYHEKIEVPFFEHFLRGSGELRLPEAYVFETGANRWREFSSWPPLGTRSVPLYFREGGRLARERPTGGATEAFDEYLSDPARPVPYFADIVARRKAPQYMVADQRFAATRPDVLVYQTDPLTQDVTVAGPITATLFVTTTGTDADWVVKLIDVYPDDFPDPDPNPRGVRMGGYQQLVRGDVMRGKSRNSYERPEPFVPGHVTKVEFVLPDAFHTFRRRHRIMVQIQSSWFPLVNRNPQTFGDIYRATEEDFRKATHRVYRAADRASRLTVNVLR
ncbi:MAG: CocE/NonD family hydrolase, partial [Gemmatimonadales bacterium]